jgi:hypothetical protein
MKNLCHSDFPLVLGVAPNPELMVALRTPRVERGRLREV